MNNRIYRTGFQAGFAATALGAMTLLAAPGLRAQAAAQTPSAATSSSATPQTPASLVQPALSRVAAAGSGVDLNKWKGSNAVKQDADANLDSIQKDLQETLPKLLTTTDSAPDAVSANVPLLLNLNALYSVLLRVDLAAKANAPREEIEALDGALAALDSARRDLGTRITASAAAQEKQVITLQAQLQAANARLAAAPPAPAAAPAATAPATAKKKSNTPPAKKPPAKPATDH